MAKAVRVRFAPSPTGSLHLGSIRSALFNWLWAQKNQGSFILRIEDTDRERLVPEAAAQISASLKWLGLEWGEGMGKGGESGPYIQSERLVLYRQHAEQLVARGQLYPCWCSPERLGELRQAAQKAQHPFKYDRHCLTHPGDPNQPHVLRFKVPGQQTITWMDAVKGKLEFASSDLDDWVAIKSDGYPTYNYANVIDDHLMRISQVIRGEEFVSSTPKHLLLYQAYGWTPPQFAHVPPVLGPDKVKLSKRHGAKAVLEYRDLGFLPEAVINYLALLGWNEGDGTTQELYSVAELVEKFSLERIQKSPAVFDAARLEWMNGHYLRQLPPAELAKRAEAFWPAEAQGALAAYRHQVLALLQERLKYFAELPELSQFFFTAPPATEVKRLLTEPDSAKYLRFALQTVQELPQFDLAHLEGALAASVIKRELGVSRQPVFATLRIALSGRTEAPGLPQTMAVLGQERVVERLKQALN